MADAGRRRRGGTGDDREARRRLAPRAALALSAIAACCLLFAVIAAHLAPDGRLTQTDISITAWFHTHAVPWLTPWVVGFTNLHGPWASIGWGSLAALLLAWRGRRADALTLAALLPAALLLNLLLKQLFERQRPHAGPALLSLTTYSFPSGHVVGATVLYGLLAAFIVRRAGGSPWRWCVVAAAAAAVALVAASRVYLGVHYLSDVIGAAAWSTAWLLLGLLAADALRWRGDRV